jgi:hypothetical protein
MEAKAKLRAKKQRIIACVEADIKDWTAMSDYQYRRLIFNTGINFLEIMEGKNGKYFERLATQKSFWNWWKNEWLMRDTAFLLHRLEQVRHLRSKYLEREYEHWHGLEHIRKNTSLEACYYRLLDAIIK